LRFSGHGVLREKRLDFPFDTELEYINLRAVSMFDVGATLK